MGCNVCSVFLFIKVLGLLQAFGEHFRPELPQNSFADSGNRALLDVCRSSRDTRALLEHSPN